MNGCGLAGAWRNLWTIRSTECTVYLTGSAADAEKELRDKYRDVEAVAMLAISLQLSYHG